MGMLLWWTLAKTSRREETEKLGDYIAELKEALQDAEERLNDLEKQCVRAQRGPDKKEPRWEAEACPEEEK